LVTSLWYCPSRDFTAILLALRGIESLTEGSP
jgi:hypothetical protein